MTGRWIFLRASDHSLKDNEKMDEKSRCESDGAGGSRGGGGGGASERRAQELAELVGGGRAGGGSGGERGVERGGVESGLGDSERKKKLVVASVRAVEHVEFVSRGGGTCAHTPGGGGVEELVVARVER
jgi:hypothetical protein